MSTLTADLIDGFGFISPRAMADEFCITVKEVAAFSGLSLDAVSKQSRARSMASQQRLREVVLLLNRVLPWCGASMRAYAWYRSEPLASFGDLTAEDLVKRGIAEAVLEEISRIRLSRTTACVVYA